jgi:uncharacterized protein (TIGR02679 family)
MIEGSGLVGRPDRGVIRPDDQVEGAEGRLARPEGRLARPDLQLLVDELVRRFRAGDVPASITVRGSIATRRALADLLGTDRVSRVGARLPIDRLLSALGLASVEELRAAVEGVRGPLPNRRDERQAAQAARDALWHWLAEQAEIISVGDDPTRLQEWVTAQRAAGVRGGIHAHRRRLESALAVLGALPADGVALASLASDRAGDPHALDHGRTVAGMVLDAVAAALGTPRPVDAEGTRLMWEAVGVVPDPLSSTVLALGLPGNRDSPIGRWLADAAATGEPVVLTLANLRRWPLPPLLPTSRAFVVENPSLIAEAAARGWTGPPVLCSSGRPTVAVVTLVRQLAAAGATIYQHADFDPVGLAISSWLAARAGTVPWHMTTSDYLASRRGRAASPAFAGTAPATPWDPELQEVLTRTQVAVFEEEIRTQLLAAMMAPGASSGADVGRSGRGRRDANGDGGHVVVEPAAAVAQDGCPERGHDLTG